MFDIGWSELLVIGIVALIAIGPKELPGALRTLGQWMGRIRRMAGEFQDQFREAMREAEVADLKKHVDDMAESARSYASFDPLATSSRPAETVMPPYQDASIAGASPEAAVGALPGPVSSDATIPSPADAAAAEVPIAPHAPQPQVSEKPGEKAGEGA
jgi:sec-independent protein translocase protein TatB